MPTATGHAQQPTLSSLTDTITDSIENNNPKNSGQFFDDRNEVSSPDYVSENPVIPGPSKQNTLDDAPITIPPEHDARTLVLCFDGTGDQFDADNSNVVQLVKALKKNDRRQQLVYYQPGIGTYTSPIVITPFMSKLTKLVDEMVAWNYDSHVMSGYEFLMQNFMDGDRISIFGFSRGAAIARSLTGMLHKVGLLGRGNKQQLPFAYKMYTRMDEVGREESEDFKATFSIDVNVDFLGVWDTVDSVGLIPKKLAFAGSDRFVRTFRHAVSLDEHRAKFKANHWTTPNEEEKRMEARRIQREKEEMAERGEKSKPDNASIYSVDDEDERVLRSMEKQYVEKEHRKTDIEEVWFAGCHCDVGGGSVSNETRHSLARIPLRWMIRECFKSSTGIIFDSKALLKIGLDPTTLHPNVLARPPPLAIPPGLRIAKSPSKAVSIPRDLHARAKKRKCVPEVDRTIREVEGAKFLGTEEEEEVRDALSPKYDQLKIKKPWWILEVLPMLGKHKGDDGEWCSHFRSNLGKPRVVPKQKRGVKVHRSVKLRMEAEFEDEKKAKKGVRYKPRAVLNEEFIIWVD